MHRIDYSRPAPKRVVSLVPSLTESMFDLGFGDCLVAITDYCIYPQDQVKSLMRVGGPKNVDVKKILELKPDFILANQEENNRENIELLLKYGMNIWLTFPKTVANVLGMLMDLCKLFRSETALRSVMQIEKTFDWTWQASGQSPMRFFCPIWHEKTNGGAWWMTCNEQTYTSDILSICGGANIFAKRMRRYPLAADLGIGEQEEPGSRDIRYPRVTIEEIRDAAPEVILLPSEPYPFDDDCAATLKQQLKDTPAVKNSRVHLIDGTLVTWCGTRLAKALVELPQLFSGS